MRAQPPEDDSQDIYDASYELVGGTTSIAFTRPCSSTDTNDIPINQCLYYLYAFGGDVTDYTNPTSILQHSNRGSFPEMVCIPDTCCTGMFLEWCQFAFSAGLGEFLYSVPSGAM